MVDLSALWRRLKGFQSVEEEQAFKRGLAKEQERIKRERIEMMEELGRKKARGETTDNNKGSGGGLGLNPAAANDLFNTFIPQNQTQRQQGQDTGGGEGEKGSQGDRMSVINGLLFGGAS